jgi:hypothetical protein
MDFRIEIDGDAEDSSSTTTTSTTAPSSTMTLSSSTLLSNKPSLLLTLDDDEDEYAKVFPIDPENPPPIELAAVYKRNNALIKSQMPVAVINTDGSVSIGEMEMRAGICPNFFSSCLQISIGIPPTPKEPEIEDGETRGGRGGDSENENEEDEEDDGGFLAFVVLTGGERM